ncbi:Double-stranded RNA-binding protein 1 [Capsicum baccatum]|uniref:Double-stranded RNA-binding protein 1 n=1 Tax=Capsicum baccatum TaxID=33114 RepID=A0A2G2XPP0_CAPBA|nr:Double-stranded RNA-binding protein 1 [Capsicum baccatum]
MYKSKLQELCQNKKWALPKYCCMRDGADHNPQFKASVVVNGINFDSPPFCKSSKEAHNEAAKFAFLHLTSGGSRSTTEDIGLTKVEGKCKSLQDKNTSETKKGGSLPTIGDSGLMKTDEVCQFPYDHLNTSEIKQGRFATENYHYQYKTKLQMYAKRKNLGVPVYRNIRKISAQDIYFEATVVVAGELFQSPGAYKTAEEAENSVAQLALMKLVTVSLEQSNTSSYKSFLEELAQQEEMCLPDYKTIRVGEPHKLAFFSSVELEGEVFHGAAAKSKKQAEENVAKVAYVALTKCKSVHAGEHSNFSSGLEGEIVKTEPIMDSLSITAGQEKFRDEEEEIVYSKHTSPKSTCAEKVIASSLSLGVKELSVNEKSPSAQSLRHLPREAILSSVAMIPSKSPTVSNVNPRAKTTAETKSYLLSNRFRVYNSIPDEVLPPGTIVLPIAEEKWAVVSLEFLNEKCG